MMNKKTAYNERFHATAAVAPQTILCGNECLYPVATIVEAVTSQSSGHEKYIFCQNRTKAKCK